MLVLGSADIVKRSRERAPSTGFGIGDGMSTDLETQIFDSCALAMKQRVRRRAKQILAAARSSRYYVEIEFPHTVGFQCYLNVTDPLPPLDDDRRMKLVVVFDKDTMRFEVRTFSPRRGAPIFFGDPNGAENLPKGIELADPAFGTRWFRDLIDRWANRCIAYLSDPASVLQHANEFFQNHPEGRGNPTGS